MYGYFCSFNEYSVYIGIWNFNNSSYAKIYLRNAKIYFDFWCRFCSYIIFFSIERKFTIKLEWWCMTFESIRKMQCKFYIFSLKNSKIFVSIPLMNKNVWRQSPNRMEFCYVKINKNFTPNENVQKKIDFRNFRFFNFIFHVWH